MTQSHFARCLTATDIDGATDSPMDVDHHMLQQQQPQEEDNGEENDPFLQFVDSARSELLLGNKLNDSDDLDGNGSSATGPGWSWTVSRILKTCRAYSSGVTSAILLTDLSQAWYEQHRIGVPRKRLDSIKHLKSKFGRKKLPNTVTIDSIYEKNFLSLNSVLEAVIVDAFVLPGTNIYMLTLGDYWSSNVIDLYLHRRYYDLVDAENGILKKGREITITGCYLRTIHLGSGHPRLLPTEYLVILLNEDQDDDAMLLGAQFCSDSFSSVSLDAVNRGISYSLYGRIEDIGPLEILGAFGSLRRKQITLVDCEGAKLKFLLWGEQIVLANLLSVASMLGLDRPYVSSSTESNIEGTEEVCLEYGSATQLYLVPYIQREEQVCVALTQNRLQSSRMLNSIDPTQGLKVSQVNLPCDALGTIDFSNYPFRLLIVDFRDKMTNVSLYGIVTEIRGEKNPSELVFSLSMKDSSGTICAKLHLSKSWSLGRIGLGHTVFLSGLSCSMTKQNRRLEVSWFENEAGCSFVNLSCLPALLNSSCLHRLTCFTDLSRQTSYAQICQVWLDPIEYFSVNVRFSHSPCGHFVEKISGWFHCSFCNVNCDDEVMHTFHLKITLADESSKVLAWCSGQTAMELLQISPEEFSDLHEDEQIMYPSSLESEKFMVALVNCKRSDFVQFDGLLQENDATSWEITRALKV